MEEFIFRSLLWLTLIMFKWMHTPIKLRARSGAYVHQSVAASDLEPD